MALLIVGAIMEEERRRGIRQQRISRDRLHPLDAYNDVELYQRYRLDREAILSLVEERISANTERAISIDAMRVELKSNLFGRTTDGEEIFRYIFKNQNNVQVEVINYGATVTRILIPDRNGVLADVNLGYEDLISYEDNPAYIGVTLGRVPNFIGKGQFELDGKTYQLPATNFGSNHLHGGVKGWNNAVWKGEIDGSSVRMSHVSPDGDEGYTGEVKVSVQYELTNDDELVITYSATTSNPTPVNLSNHCYFNVAGENLDDHMITIHAEKYLIRDEHILATGEIADVTDTLMDLRKPVMLVDRIAKVNNGTGYNNTFCYAGVKGKKSVSRMDHPPSGRYIEVYTTHPALHFYTSEFLGGTKGKGGKIYTCFSAFCFEAQNYADAVNHAHFPDSILRPNQAYDETIIYKFGVKD